MNSVTNEWVYSHEIGAGSFWTRKEDCQFSTEPEQFLGFLDRNKHYIYEGDILARWDIDYDAWNDLDYNGDAPYKLDNGTRDVATMERFPRFWLRNESFGYEGEDLETSSEWEVIGNIHENPELLNSNKEAL